MAAVKIVLRTREKKNGLFPLALRITKNRKSSFIYVGFDIDKIHWDENNQRVKKTHPNSTRLNNLLFKKLAEANDTSLTLETIKKDVSSYAVKQKIKPTAGDTFFSQAAVYLDTLKKTGRQNSYAADHPRIKHFKDFLQGNDIAFSDITVSLLQKYKTYLLYKKTRKGVVIKRSDRTIMNHLAVIRAVFSQAIKLSLVDQQHYPFGHDKIRIKFPDSLKIGLSIEEVQRLEELSLDKNSFLNHARNVWLFSFYFAGMRVSDVLRIKWTDIQNDRLHYSMAKNAKGGSLKIPNKAMDIINQYEKDKRKKDDLIFPDLKVLDDFRDNIVVQKKIANAVHRLDKNLQKHIAPMIEITKPLTMHIARHTFGNISGDKISIQMLQKLYRHSSITTTIGYQNNFIHKDADAALDSVIIWK